MLIGLLFLFFSWKIIYLARTGLLDYESYGDQICNPSIILPQALIERYWLWIKSGMSGMAVFVIFITIVLYVGIMTASIIIIKTFLTAVTPDDSPYHDSGDRAFGIYLAIETVVILLFTFVAFHKFLQDTNKTLKRYKKANPDNSTFNEDALNKVLYEDSSSDEEIKVDKIDVGKKRKQQKTKEELDNEEIEREEDFAIRRQSEALLQKELTIHRPIIPKFTTQSLQEKIDTLKTQE